LQDKKFAAFTGSFQLAARGSAKETVPDDTRTGDSVVGIGFHRGRRWVLNVEGLVWGNCFPWTRTSLKSFQAEHLQAVTTPGGGGKGFTDC